MICCDNEKYANDEKQHGVEEMSLLKKTVQELFVDSLHKYRFIQKLNVENVPLYQSFTNDEQKEIVHEKQKMIIEQYRNSIFEFFYMKIQ